MIQPKNTNLTKKSKTLHKEAILKFSLIGNPNSGKTTLFNQLTGSTQYVGNWPGVTVEKKEGKSKFKKQVMKILDLPGIYSLSPYSPEEIITRNSLINDPPDAIINVVDSTNIERNLYLTTQIAEFGIPIVVALNMIDIFNKKGDTVNIKELERKFGVCVVPISASRGEGLEKLIERALEISKKKVSNYKTKSFYNSEVDYVIKKIENIISDAKHKKLSSTRWGAVKLFEDDQLILKSIKLNKSQFNKINILKNRIKTSKNVDRQVIIADQRYKYICSVCNKVVKKCDREKETFSDRIDKILTHKILAIPIFFFFIFIIFNMTFGSFGEFLKEKVAFFIDEHVTNFFINILVSAKASLWTKSLVLDGIVKGVGAAASFLPQIVILFSLLSILEDSGYMSRCAFIMDKLLRKLGLSGKSFVPLLMGFGCTVPAVMSTRTIENQKDRRLTIFVIPFMSCSAKMPIYALMVPIFFSENQPLIIFLLYLIGVLVAIFSAVVLKKTVAKGESAPFIMELPQYRMPTIKSLFMHVWERVKDFLKRAGTVLLACSIIIWFFESFNFKMQMVESSHESMLAKIAAFISPIFTPCGFGDWRASVALVAGIAAKESVVSTMAVLYNTIDTAELSKVVSNVFSKASAFSFMTFVLLYTPCIAAVSAIRQEFENTKLTFFAVIYQLVVAWVVSAFVFFVCNIFLM
ncbi:MAG: ferrous iron transport protein B [Oscillospiraceae bacterium]|jgi:ferrous iron transport protein B|nr:ferrous iron transport protein B [Oscillospiraceae bacterium]